jgi:hypothetical protein
VQLKNNLTGILLPAMISSIEERICWKDGVDGPYTEDLSSFLACGVFRDTNVIEATYEYKMSMVEPST